LLLEFLFSFISAISAVKDEKDVFENLLRVIRACAGMLMACFWQEPDAFSG
jgi:hypothetical protein